MTRFDDPAHLEVWRRGDVPAIYQPAFDLALETAGEWDGPVLDFACGTGILGALVGMNVLPADYPDSVVGTDGDAKRLNRGREFGIRHTLALRPVKDITDVLQYGRWLKHIQPRMVLMRRAIADVFDRRPGLVPTFAAELAGNGVKHLIVEGRVEVANAVNPFPSIEHEVVALAPHYREVERRGRLSYLEVAA